MTNAKNEEDSKTKDTNLNNPFFIYKNFSFIEGTLLTKK